MLSLINELTVKLLAYGSLSYQADKMLKSIYTDVTEGMLEVRGLFEGSSIGIEIFASSDCEIET